MKKTLLIFAASIMMLTVTSCGYFTNEESTVPTNDTVVSTVDSLQNEVVNCDNTNS